MRNYTQVKQRYLKDRLQRRVLDSDSDFSSSISSSSESDSSSDNLVSERKQTSRPLPTAVQKRAARCKEEHDASSSSSSSSLENYIESLKIYDDDDKEHSKIPVTIDVSHVRKHDLYHHDGTTVDGSWIFKEHNFTYNLRRVGNDYPDVQIPKRLYHNLYDFQKVGVEWLASLHSKGIGGILGDDMGMGKSKIWEVPQSVFHLIFSVIVGKTYMACTFIGGLMRSGVIRNALIVAPMSVLRSWEKTSVELISQCIPKVNIQVVSGGMSRNQRSFAIQKHLRQ
jgi:SNF2 family DNA or RNA helicase